MSDKIALLIEASEARGRIATLEAENAELRAAMESLFPNDEGYTEAFDELVKRGLIVRVPSDEAYRDEWGDEEWMYAWRWRALEGPQPDTRTREEER